MEAYGYSIGSGVWSLESESSLEPGSGSGLEWRRGKGWYCIALRSILDSGCLFSDMVILGGMVVLVILGICGIAEGSP